jgi:hypothetical protein
MALAKVYKDKNHCIGELTRGCRAGMSRALFIFVFIYLFINKLFAGISDGLSPTPTTTTVANDYYTNAPRPCSHRVIKLRATA